MSTTLIENSQMPRSALRHRPIASNLQEQVPLHPRATKEKHEPHTTGGLPSSAKQSNHTPATIGDPLSSAKQSNHMLATIGLSMLITCLLLWSGQGLWTWGTTQIDTLRYGYPRAMHIDRAVGHEQGKTLSHFEALNIKGQIYVIEIPGGNVSNARLLLGPHLFGPGADLEPVTLTFPGNVVHPDLLLEVHGIETRFHNTGKSYIPA